ncbi:probable inactive ATP-dependent zinc metalloprotease FTSHI 5, chloroplastic isoform X2 [Vigna unguiculata]|uniref:probable inactive ATP-dependent zinc metalloprotease FTSHI 5, chloroplastic isoform X2 n=1 Tax=Vigna unguiculata TaxID=3917 RepID=UPI0010170E88|nr:probable inactive ATP-dependent zinc metalloprotease FTSHI 5, chloroplastic isoform X2 [Vigna unguiculata]
MDSIIASSPLQFPHRPLFTSIRPIPIRTLISNSRRTPRTPLSLVPIAFTPPITSASKSTTLASSPSDDVFLKQLVRALFCFAVGFSALGAFRTPPPALAIAVPWNVFGTRGAEKEKAKSHKYSDCTDKLLETVSLLLGAVDEARKGNGDVSEVEAALKAVKSKKQEMKKAIDRKLYPALRKLRNEKKALWKRSGEILGDILKATAEYDRLKTKAVANEKEKARMMELEEIVRKMENEYNEGWERVGEIEDQISREETVALSYGAREINFIEKECEQLVERFKQEIRRKDFESLPTGPVTRLSKSVIQKDLETVHRKHAEQIILPSILDVEDLGPFFHQESINFAQRLKRVLKDSREKQRNLEAQIRKKMKKFGKEKRNIIYSPHEDVLKGFPEVELKWMFGNKEVVLPKAVGLHLYHGWKKWREEAKANLKQSLIKDAEFGRQYVAERQERILLDRDRVVSRTWYNEEKKRWEMDPVAVPYAVSKRLIEYVRIRHDWGAMYIVLKGEDKQFYVDIREFEMVFEDLGGFDGLYMKMLACGIPTAVHLMWIPFSELNIRQQLLLILRVCNGIVSGLWNSRVVTQAKNWTFTQIKDTTDDIMVLMVFPIVEFLVPYPVRIQLGMAWPEEIYQTVDTTWYLKWQSEAESNFKSRQPAVEDGESSWSFKFLVRAAIYGFVLFHVVKFMRRKLPRLLGFGPLRRNPNRRKLRRVKYYIGQKLKKIKQRRKDGFDPIKTAFEQMKRVKKPPIPLKNFASVESMKEEINEVVAFLQNPRAFQEMGAQAPRAPVIIFVEDFDLFAGVRGTYIHTKNQDHETFINQLLVELDGFEKQDGVVLMATTRNLKQIDEALQRPGRMDRIFHLQRPTQAEREKILYLAAKETMDDQLIDYVDWKKVAEKTALLRPIELKVVPMALEGSAFRGKVLDTDELMGYCGFFATFSSMVPSWLRKTKVFNKFSKAMVNHLGLTLTKEDLQNVVDLMEPYGQINNGIEFLSPPLDWTRETKFPHAVWAAGRGLTALLLPNFDVVDNLWLEPQSWQGIGCTKITKARNEGSINGNSESRSYLEKKLVFCFGSYVASQMLLPFGEENLLSIYEIQQAQEIATRMVIQYGWGPDDSPAIYYHSNAVTALSMGDDHEYVMAAKVEKMFDLAYLKAREMLLKNRPVLEKIVEELLEFEILTGKDLERITKNNGVIREKEPFTLGEIQASEPTSVSLLERRSAPGSALLAS